MNLKEKILLEKLKWMQRVIEEIQCKVDETVCDIDKVIKKLESEK